jgi:hypothetical protein
MLTPPPQDLPAKQALLLRELKSSFHIDGVYVGFADGTYIQATNLATNPAWRDALNAPADAAFAVRAITKVIGIPVTTWTFFDEDIRPLARRADGDDVFDPRSRPWYKAAVSEGRTTSVGPYVSAATNYLTLTFATPVAGKDQVVIGADVMLVTLGEVVDTGTISEEAHGYVFDSTGRLIVHSDPVIMTKLRDQMRRGRLMSVADVAATDPAIPAVANLAQECFQSRRRSPRTRYPLRPAHRTGRRRQRRRRNPPAIHRNRRHCKHRLATGGPEPRLWNLDPRQQRGPQRSCGEFQFPAYRHCHRQGPNGADRALRASGLVSLEQSVHCRKALGPCQRARL